MLITNQKLDKYKLRMKWTEWGEEGELLPTAFDHAPDEAEVRTSLFTIAPVEWNRLPHFQVRQRSSCCCGCQLTRWPIES